MTINNNNNETATTNIEKTDKRTTKFHTKWNTGTDPLTEDQTFPLRISKSTYAAMQEFALQGGFRNVKEYARYAMTKYINEQIAINTPFFKEGEYNQAPFFKDGE